jgi:23S rRNA (uridine2552-2'-O)-methyltransferase
MKGKADYYWRKSKEEGYPARSVYKLQELQEKHTLVKPGNRVLDLGCSPGSWSLMILDILGGNGTLTGVDLNEPDKKLLSRKGFRFILGDFFKEETLAAIAAHGPYDAVLSDAAPSTSGNRTTDTARSLEIGLRVLEIADRVLAPGGSMAVKIFQGGEERQVLERMKARFAEARAFKPKASRSDSMEIYFAARGFAAAAGS